MSGAQQTKRVDPFLGIQSPLGRRLVLSFYIFAELAYLFWRIAFTVSGAHSIYAWLLLFAEIYVIANATWFYLLAGPKKQRTDPPIPTLDLTVDVFLTTYNEDESLVRTTAIAARDMDYPHETWILDDGRRPNIEKMAEELGVGYITRPTNEHYKAGNMNNALGHTTGDLVLVLDADHIPRRNFLTRLVGYFEDPEVSLVQTPQIYYNVGSYQHRTSMSKGLMWHEGRIFQHRIMAGAERAGCAFFIGTGGLLRREALESIGGFATGSVTEDIYTSMRLHAKGYRSVFVDEPLGYLQAPQSPHAYALQRLRWAQGGLQILRRENPLTQKGLTPFQRVAYFISLSHSLASFPNLIFYLAPALYLLFMLIPINAAPEVVIPMMGVHMLVNLIVYRLLSAPDGRVLESSFFKFVNLPIHLRASMRLLFPEGLAFKVTPKGRQSKAPAELWVTAAALTLVHALAISVGISRVLEGQLNLWVAALSFFFSTGFIFLGLFVLRRTFGMVVEDEVIYVSVNMDTLVRPSGEADWRLSRLQRLGPATAVVDCPWKVQTGDLLQLDLSTSGMWRPLNGRVTGVRPSNIRSRTTVELDLVDLELEEQDTINSFLFNTALPTFLSGFVDAQTDGPPPEPVVRREDSASPLAAFTPDALPSVGKRRLQMGTVPSVTGSFYRVVSPTTSDSSYGVVPKPADAEPRPEPRPMRPLVWINPKSDAQQRRHTPSELRTAVRAEPAESAAPQELTMRTGRQPRLAIAPPVAVSASLGAGAPMAVDAPLPEHPSSTTVDFSRGDVSITPTSLARVELQAVARSASSSATPEPASACDDAPPTNGAGAHDIEHSGDDVLSSDPDLNTLLEQYLQKEDLKN